MSDDLAEDAAELIQETNEKYQERKEEQAEFLDAVAEEEGEPPLETQCNLIADYTVPLRAKLNGEIMDKMGAVDARLERLENEQGRAYEISETADTVAQLLADVIDDPEWHKDKFYAVYESEGLDPLGLMLERAFEQLKEEKERRDGSADGFRP